MDKYIDDGLKKEFLINNEKYVLHFWQDCDSTNPREWDKACKLYCWHSRYNALGDKHEFETITDILTDLLQEKGETEQFIESIIMLKQDETYKQRDIRIIEYLKDFAYIKFIYCYEHSGFCISTSDFGDKWDSGLVGIAVLTKQAYMKYGFNSENEWAFMADKYIEQRIEEYNQWLNNDIYGFTVDKQETCKHCGQTICTNIDSVGGFYGNNIYENGMLEYMPDEIVEAFKNGKNE